MNKNYNIFQGSSPAVIFFLICSITLFGLRISPAQTPKVLRGTVKDSLSGYPVPYATVALTKSLQGTVTNDAGEFILNVEDAPEDENLIITLLGFHAKEFPLRSVQSPLHVMLSPASIELKEVLVNPLPPTHYIRMAMRSLRQNYPAQAYETQSYYREIIQENGAFLRSHEGVFRSYTPNFQDSVKSQHQLLLFRKANDLREMAFMKKERLKESEKDQKKAAKAIRKGREVKKKEVDDSLKIGDLFGGPENLLRLAGLFKDPGNYLDTNEFKEYTYSFARFSSYNNAALMVIDFKSKGKVDYVREEGRIFLDIASNAIVKVESKGVLVVPALAKPVLLIMGIGVKNPVFQSSISFRQVKGLWYPNTMLFNLRVQVERKRLFSANDNSLFVIDGILTVNKLKTTGAVPVEAKKRYSQSKRPEQQVYNDESIDWSSINVIEH